MKLRDKIYKLKFNFGDFKQGECLQVTDLVYSNKRFNAIVKIGKTKTKIPWAFIKTLDEVEKILVNNPKMVDWVKSINNKYYFSIENAKGIIVYRDYIRV